MTSPVHHRQRVVFVTPSFAGGGAERVMVTFANELDPQRFQVAMVALSAEGPLRSLLDDHVRLFVMDRPRVRQAFPQLLSLLRRLAPDAVISSAPHLSHPLLAARWLLHTRTRLIVREASLPSRALPLAPFPKAVAWGLHHLYPRADAVIASSSRMREELAAFGTSAERIHVVPNPVDVEVIRRLSNPPERQSGPGRRLLAVGRLVPQKGFDRLIPALANLPADDRLTILGEGPERSRLEAVRDASGLGKRVDLPGFMDNPWSWVSGADVLLVPSRTEGLPNAVLEALAVGTRVIATPECGGIEDIAAFAPRGAVQVVPIEGFLQAIDGVEAAPPEKAPNLLPARYRKGTATVALAETLSAVAPLESGQHGARRSAVDPRSDSKANGDSCSLKCRQAHSAHWKRRLSAEEGKGNLMRLSRPLGLFLRAVRVLIAPKSSEQDAFAVLSRVARYLVPRYRLPSPNVDWLDDPSFLAYQRTFSVSPASAHRHFALQNLVKSVRDVEGDTAECGVYRGASSSLILAANERDAPLRTHHIFDSFEGLSSPDSTDGGYWSAGHLSAPLEEVRRNLADRRYRLYPGWIPDRFNEVADEVFCFVHIDVDLYQPTTESLRFFYPRLSVGGVILCDDYGSSRCPGATRACDEFAAEHQLTGFVGLPAGGGFIIRR